MTWSDITKNNINEIINNKNNLNIKKDIEKINPLYKKMNDFFETSEFNDIYFYISEYLDIKYIKIKNIETNLVRSSSTDLQSYTFKFMKLFEIYNPFFFISYNPESNQNIIQNKIDLHGLYVKDVWVILCYLLDNNMIDYKIKNNYEIITGKGNHSINIPKKQFSDIKYKNNKIINQIEGTYYNKLTKATKSLLEYYEIKYKYQDGIILIKDY